MSPRERPNEVEDWRSALLKLPDSVFFDIMRNYLGELKTPFNKHSLIDELSTFLRGSETRERLLRHIDENDARVLTAVHVLNEPSLDRLFTFFEGSLSYLELHYLLLNLQERLLVFIQRESREQHLLLNPLLDALLHEQVIDPELLFPSRRLEAVELEPVWPTDALLLALYSHLSSYPDLLKSDGDIKKRAFEELISVFPTLADENRAKTLLFALFRMGLLENESGVVSPRHPAWGELAVIDTASRRALLWAAIIHTRAILEAQPGSAPIVADSPGRLLEEEARMLMNFLANVPDGRAMSEIALRRLLGIFLPESSGSRAEAPSPSAAYLHRLSRLGLLQQQTHDGEDWYTINPYLRAAGQTEPRPVVVEPNFQLTMKPSIEFADGLAIAATAEIRRFDVYPRYEMTKRSFVRRLEQEGSAEATIELLERLGGGPLPQNVRFTMTSWEKEFRGVALYRGIVLTADPERRHLIEHSAAVRPWIRRTLAPGVYLLDENGITEWSRALTRSGIDPVPQIQEARGGSIAPPFRRFGKPIILSYTASRQKSDGESERADAAADLVDELNSQLDRLEIPADLSSELRARIAKKLILFPNQLEQSQPRAEKNEAKGLDYVGKVRLVEQALKSGSDLLEILERTSNGATRRLLVRPSDLKKSGNDLVLQAHTLPENELVQIRVRKIGLVRKLKSSLYAP